jgi:hypothetical protein
MGWWVAERGDPLSYAGPTEVNQDAAKRVAIARSTASPGTVFQVRYHINANAPAEVRWEAVNGRLTEGTGNANAEKSAEPSATERSDAGPAAPVAPKPETRSTWQSIRRWFT